MLYVKKIIPYCIAAVIGVSSFGYILKSDFNVKAELNSNIEKTVFSKIEIQQETKGEVIALTNERRTVIYSRGGQYDGFTKEINRNIEVLDWWTEASVIFPRGAIATAIDVYTGIQFNIVRTMGDNHADCETLTVEDTEKMKQAFGGFSWQKRPVIITINGRNIAASMAGMPHAGNDAAPAFAVADNLSDGYGTGENLDVIKGNGMDGHFDVHFLNSLKHADGHITATIDETHQENIKIAAQYKIP
jgi:hypothetical protein